MTAGRSAPNEGASLFVAVAWQDTEMYESSTQDLYERVAARFGDLVESCRAESWSAPSPCPGWTAWDVAAHVVRNHRRALAGLDGSRYSAPTRDEDVREAWRSASEGVRQALRDPTLAGTQLAAEFDACTFETFIRRMACADMLIHTWDFARATEQDERLDPEGVAVATSILVPEDRDIRMPHAFGPKVSPADDADPQTRLLNFLGRRP